MSLRYAWLTMTISAHDAIWGPLLPGGAADQIVRRLGEAMGAGVLFPGEKLPTETELARRFDVSPMTVRQALAALRAEGYIHTRRGREGGSFVREDIADQIATVAERSTFSETDLRALTDWRRIISGGAAALAARIATPQNIATLEVAAQKVHEVTDEPGQYRLMDARFHILTAEIAASGRVVAAETEIQQELTTYIAPAPGVDDVVRASSHAAHLNILGAISQGRDHQARIAMEEHAESTYNWLMGLHLGQLDAASRHRRKAF